MSAVQDVVGKLTASCTAFEDALSAYPYIAAPLVVLGLLSVLCAGWKFLGALRFLTYSSKSMKRYGTWAAVTGGTDGIGLGFVRELARQGVNVLIISRSAEKLAATKETLEKEFGARGVKFDTVAADLSQANAVTAVVDKFREVEVGILINNAAISYDHAEYLHEISDDLVARLIQLNISAVTRLAKAVIPGMVSRKKGLIINIGSGAGTMPTGDPLYAVYSGTKAYVDAFSKSLYYELKSKGVHVECSVPLFVASKMSRIRKPTLMAPSANAFARVALARSGRLPSIVPFTSHAIQDWVAHSVPTWVLSKYLLSHHFDVRQRALNKKKAEEKKE